MDRYSVLSQLMPSNGLAHKSISHGKDFEEQSILIWLKCPELVQSKFNHNQLE